MTNCLKAKIYSVLGANFPIFMAYISTGMVDCFGSLLVKNTNYIRARGPAKY